MSNPFEAFDSENFRRLLKGYSQDNEEESLMEILLSERELIKEKVMEGMTGKALYKMLTKSNMSISYSFFMTHFKKFRENNISTAKDVPYVENEK